jgi:hypothetical protein
MGVAARTGWTTELSDFHSRCGQEFSHFHVGQNGSGALPASCLMTTGGSLPSIKRTVRAADYSHPTTIEVKNTRVYTFTPPYFFTAKCLIN